MPRIPLLLIAFFDPNVVGATLQSLNPLRDKIDVWIVENQSQYSHLLHSKIAEFKQSGLVSRHFLFDENISCNAIQIILEKEIDLRQFKYVMVTDGDVISYDPGWFKESVAIMDHHADVFCIGGRLDFENLPLKNFPEATGWDSPMKIDRGDYIEGIMGALLWVFRGPQLAETLAYLRANNLEFRDMVLLDYCYKPREMKWAITKQASVRHLTWDSYSNIDHPYTKFKLSKSFEEHWSHSRQSSYKKINDRCVTHSEEQWPAPDPIDRQNRIKWQIINWLTAHRLYRLIKYVPALRR